MKSEYENMTWDHSVNMYAKWKQLEIKTCCEESKRRCRDMLNMHRKAFPTMKKIFDRIDSEIEG